MSWMSGSTNMNGRTSRIRGFLVWSGVALVVGALHGCGGGGSGGAFLTTGTAAEQTGVLIVALTDAEGDFIDYSVDVTSVRLEKVDGSTVETLPLNTRVNFAELTEVTEFLTIATVPAGVYQSVSLGLNFSDAEILVQNEQGDTLTAEARDEQNDPLGAVTVRLHLASIDRIRIAPGIPAAFSLDFDLDASNTIDLLTAPPTVRVLPLLLASAELEADRAHRLRGVLADVDESAQTVTLKVRPFRHRTGNFGEFSFSTDTDTLFEIDGVTSSGSQGLTMMAALEENTPVIALGMVVDGSYLAGRVLAGSSVPWSQSDVVKGVVAAREGDTLTVRGATVGYRDGIETRFGEVRVHLGDDTRVTAFGLDNSQLTEDSVSVGQRVVAFGDVLDDGSLDATDSHVRMQISQLTATVIESMPMVVDLHFLSARRPGVYDFSGTGVSAGDDADPASYEVETATLPLLTIDAGDLVQVRGHVNGFGMAPADFNALTVIDVDTDLRSAVFVAGWEAGTDQPFSAIGSARIDLDLSEARSALKVRGVPAELTNPLEALALLATDNGTGVYAVRVRGAGEINLYREFSTLVDELISQLDTGNLLKHVGVHGRYTVGSSELTAGRAGFEFVESQE